MSEKMQLIEDAFATISKYTKLTSRPGLMDVYAYDVIIGMYESDNTEEEDSEYYLWRKTPDEILEFLIEDSKIFDIEYGWDQFDEDIREYLIENEFIVTVDEISDEEYQTLKEKRK